MATPYRWSFGLTQLGGHLEKWRLLLLFFGDGESHGFHLVHHLLALLGKFRDKQQGCRLLQDAIVSDDGQEGLIDVTYV